MKKSIQNHLKKLSLFFIALLLSGAGWAQRSINGTVSDESGQALPGVSVVVKGTTIGVATNIDGKYVLEVPGNATTIAFSFIGMKNQEEQISGRTTINVVLAPETIGLEEVVAVGYGVQKKATLTGSVGNIKSEELLRRPAANTTDLLTGTISGLITRQSSGIPGGDGTTLNIRGFSSSPLVIIDGIEGTLGQIDPNDIESISVLKDASAAIYGARAGNGVILVTTKRGTEMESRISYHGTVSFTQPTFLPDRVSADKWAEMLNETGLDVNLYTPAHVKYDKTTNTLNNTADGSIYKGYDWSETLMRDWTPQHQHNLSATGGSKNVKYFISAGFTDQESNFKSGDYDFNRYNIRSNVDAKINNNLSVSVDFSYRTQILDKANFTLEDMYNSLETAKPVYPVIHENDPTRATYSGFLQRSPYAQTFKDFSGSIRNRTNVIQGAFELKYSFPMIKGLAAKARFTYEEVFGWDKTISKPFDVWEYNQLAAGTPNEWIKRGTQNTNRLSVTSDRSTDLLPLVSLEYERKFSDHSLKGIIIGETRTFNSTSLSGSRKDLLSYEAPYLRYASQSGIDNNENANEVARTGIIGRINYDYKGKYILEVAMRADASAEYPEKGRWGFFPSISGGWRISEEPFIKNNFKAVDNLKLRASYGVLGYDAVSSFAYLTGYLVSASSYLFGTTPAPIISSAGLPNPDITWETMTLYNVGLDGNFRKGLLGFEVDVFYRLREDILATPEEQVPSTFGATLPQTNLNKRDNRGVEISLIHKNNIGKFTYEISPMISWSRGKFVSLQEEISATDPEWNARYVNEGQWDDRFWAYEGDGFL